MTTPTKEQIRERATDLFNNSNRHLPSISPEDSELRENGLWFEARNELMRDTARSQQLSYVEGMANELGFELKKTNPSELAKQTRHSEFEIDVKELLRSGCIIIGGKGTAKSNLAMTITDMLMRIGVTVKVFDISKAWQRSSVPCVVEITNNIRMDINLYQSIVFDLCKLTPNDAKRFITLVLAKEWNMQTSLTEEQRKPIVFVFEECQLLTPNGSLRSNEAQQVLRLMSTGRNFELGYLAISQRPTLVDPTVFELSFIRYFSRCDGFNDLKRIAEYIGSEKARQLQKLRLGEFMYDRGIETKLIKTQEFRSNVKLQRIATYPVRK